MKTALIVFDTFDDYNLFAAWLDELNVTEVVFGTINGHKMQEKYCNTRPDVKISIAQ